jgi:hypothetical protein
MRHSRKVVNTADQVARTSNKQRSASTICTNPTKTAMKRCGNVSRALKRKLAMAERTRLSLPGQAMGNHLGRVQLATKAALLSCSMLV